MHIGVPARGKRHAQLIRETRTHHAHFAGAGDVKDVGTKSHECIPHLGNVPRKYRIEAQIFFESERKKSTRQLERLHVALIHKCLRTITCPHTQKWQPAPPRKSLKMAAGVGYSIHFMK